MDRPNTLALGNSTGTTVFSMEEDGEIWFRQNWKPGVDQVVINLEADETISNGTEYDPIPSITLSWLDSPFNLNGLLGRSIHIPRSYDEEQHDHVATFYYGEHLDFNDVHIDFIERDGERLHIKITGKADDVDVAEPGMMDIEINATIRFVDRHSPRVLEPSRVVDGVGTFNETEWYWTCEGRYDDRPVEIRLCTGDNFDRLASFARSVISQEQISPSKMRADIVSHLPLLKWKFDHFGVVPHFEIDKFYPQVFSVSQSDENDDGVSLNIFLAHPVSGNDQWILRYVDRECESLEWIPDSKSDTNH